MLGLGSGWVSSDVMMGPESCLVHNDDVVQRDVTSSSRAVPGLELDAPGIQQRHWPPHFSRGKWGGGGGVLHKVRGGGARLVGFLRRIRLVLSAAILDCTARCPSGCRGCVVVYQSLTQIC